MKVVHDWDNPYLNRRYALERGLKLILYGLSNKLPFLNRLDCVKRIRREVRDYADTLAKLDMLIGVRNIFGIRDKVADVYPNVAPELREEFNADVRTHIHIGKNNDVKRIRFWDYMDGLEGMTSRLWHFDKQYFLGNHIELLEGEYAIWHVDYPSFLRLYIEWLYDMLILTKR